MLVVSIIALMYAVGKGAAETGAVLNLEFLCFQNPGHLNNAGEICDAKNTKICNPSFKICVSHQAIHKKLKKINCPLYLTKSISFSKLAIVCKEKFDTRRFLAKIMEINLPFPLQESYFIKINAKDGNQESTNVRYIADFTQTIQQAPYSSEQNNTFEESLMNRFDKNSRNSNASLRIAYSIRCVRNPKSDNCSSLCQSYPTDTYTCSEQGKKICKSNSQCYQLELPKGNTNWNVIIPIIIVTIVAIQLIIVGIVLYIRRKLSINGIREQSSENKCQENPKLLFKNDDGKLDLTGNIYEDPDYFDVPEWKEEYSHYMSMSKKEEGVTRKSSRGNPLPMAPIG